MLRRLAFAAFAATVLGISACGRQITPDPNSVGGTGNNNLSGKMVIRFRVRGTLDFTNVNYAIVINTSGAGGEPYPQAYLNSYTNYSYTFVVGANYGGAGETLPTLLQYIPVAGTANQLNPHVVPLGASTTQLVPQDSLAGNEFQLTFTREQLDNPLAVATSSPSPSVTDVPTASPSPSPGLTSSPSPSPSPSGFAATPSPIPFATSQAQRIWYINFFTLDRNGTPIDSLGLGGATDQSFTFQIDTATQNLFPIFRPSGVTYPSNLSAAIDGGEVDTYP